MWYLTYYEEYPIYEAAEGGYYYAGVSEGYRYEFTTLNAALEAVPELAEDLLLDFVRIPSYWEDWKPLAYNGRKYVANHYDRYIGEDRYLVLETPSTVGGLECGWHPYE